MSAVNSKLANSKASKSRIFAEVVKIQQGSLKIQYKNKAILFYGWLANIIVVRLRYWLPQFGQPF
jgi:hypothetical protein